MKKLTKLIKCQQAQILAHQEQLQEDMIELSKAQLKKLADKLSTQPHSFNISKVLIDLGFRSYKGECLYIQDNIAWSCSPLFFPQFFHNVFSAADSGKPHSFFSSPASRKKQDYLEQLPLPESKFLRDDAKTKWLFFADTAIKITGARLEPIAYQALPGLVRAEKINPHNLDFASEKAQPSYWESSKVWQFFQNTCTNPNNNQLDQDLLEHNMMGLAKLAHSFNNVADPCAVILSEKTNSGETNAGGTGKGIYLQCLANLGLSCCRKDGKLLNLNYEHSLGNLKPETDLLIFDDPNSTKRLLQQSFSMLTEGTESNPKGREQVFISAENMPRIVITTNDLALGSDDSHLRRRFDIVLHRFYNNNHRPIDDVGRLFDKDFAAEEWNKYFFVMMHQIHAYLSKVYSQNVMPRGAMAKLLYQEVVTHDIGEKYLDYFNQKYLPLLDAGQDFVINLTDDVKDFATTVHNTTSQEYNKRLFKYLKQLHKRGFVHVPSKQINGQTKNVYEVSAVQSASPLLQASGRSKANRSTKKII